MTTDGFKHRKSSPGRRLVGTGQNLYIDEAAGFLYAGTPAGVKRWVWSKTLAAGGTGEDVVTGQPSNGNHSKHTVKVWDGWLYVMSGSAENVVNPDSPAYDQTRSQIKRFRLSDFKPGTPFNWPSDGEVFANGLRNTLGFNRDARGRIYGVQNGQDDVQYQSADVHQDNPGEVVMRLEAGTSHGYPFCFVAQSVSGVQPGTQLSSSIFTNNPHDDAWCQSPANALPPVTFLQAHTAPMDIVFYTGPFGALPDKWKNGAFVSLHGSWNRTTATATKWVWLPFNADGSAPLPTNSGSTTTFTFDVVFGKTADQSPTRRRPGLTVNKCGPSESRSPRWMARCTSPRMQTVESIESACSNESTVLDGLGLRCIARGRVCAPPCSVDTRDKPDRAGRVTQAAPRKVAPRPSLPSTPRQLRAAHEQWKWSR
ncbi:MAG: hypothetical protein WDO74_07455 [Pseudomonadota bacterium]